MTVLKLEFLPHYQRKTAFEVSWKNLNPMTTGCTFAAECERRYTANLMRMLTYHFSSKTTFRNIDYVFIICLVFQYYSVAKGSIKMQLSLKQKTEKILNINWSNNLRGYFCSSHLVKFLCLDHRFYSRFFF